MKLKKSKMVCFPIEIYGGIIFFAYGMTTDAIIKALESEGEDEEFIQHIKDNKEASTPCEFGGITVSDGVRCLISIAKMRDELEFYNTLSHEVFHAVHSILKLRGMKLSNKTEEAYAYLTGWMTEKILM